MVVELVDSRVVRTLRHRVLRPGRPASESEYPDDDHPRVAHVAVMSGTDPGQVVAVGSVLPEAPPWEPRRSDGWRVRGMATRPDARGEGLGALVLRTLVDHVAAQGGGLVWCNARVPAQGLYGRAGFATRGAVFELRFIGPHVQMWRTVPRAGPPVPR